MWASEVALKYPNAQVVALDMSNEQYPPGWTMPKNLSFDTYNVLEPTPDKYVGYYDIVHIRFIVGGMKGTADFVTVIENVSKLLSMLSAAVTMSVLTRRPKNQEASSNGKTYTILAGRSSTSHSVLTWMSERFHLGWRNSTRQSKVLSPGA